MPPFTMLTGFLILTTLVAGLTPEAETLERTVPMMGTVLHLQVQAEERGQALAASEAAVRALEATEARLSTWREGSELNALNRAATDREVVLSPALARELTVAKACWKATEGGFDPAIGAVLETWNLRGEFRMAPAEVRQKAMEGSRFDKLVLAPGRARRTHPRLLLHAGAFGKGAGLDRAAEALASLQPPVQALLDLGGQLATMGTGAFWTVGIAHPRRRDTPVLQLQIESGSLSTSGNSERGVIVGGKRYSHILDPRTGKPAEDFGSLTVVIGKEAPEPFRSDPNVWADCLSTGLYVLGAEKALAWGEGRPGIDVLALEVVDDHLRARATSGLASRLEPSESDLEVETFPSPHQP